MRESTGVDCRVLRRADRQGYKAGALEAGRRQTDAEFLVIFDADFLPPADYLERAIPHFYRADGEPDAGLALVQTQWGHLNADESPLTRAQSLWVDDHHTLQMSWRSAVWQFVNFTGTAGVWRASAIEAAGGWRAASLVEDCELSFRHLFAGYRTKFVKEIVAPAELPGDLHRLQGAAEALDPGLGAAPAAAPADAAAGYRVLAGPAPRLRVPHVHLLAVAGVGAVADHAAAS